MTDKKIKVILDVPEDVYYDLYRQKGTKRSWYTFLIGENLEVVENDNSGPTT